MTLNQLASKIAKLEGKKSQARIGDIREVLGIMSDIIYGMGDHTEVGQSLFVAGAKRAKRKPKAKKKG